VSIDQSPANSTTDTFDRFLEQVRAELMAYVGRRYFTLDHYWVEDVVQRTILKFWRWAESERKKGNPRPVSCPDNYRPLIFGRLSGQAFADVLREAEGRSITLSDRVVAETEAETTMGYRETLGERHWQEMMDWFWRELEKRTSDPISDALLELAQACGAGSRAEEFLFAEDYLFERSDSDGLMPRREKTKFLCDRTTKNRNALYQALFRLRTVWCSLKTELTLQIRAPDKSDFSRLLCSVCLE